MKVKELIKTVPEDFEIEVGSVEGAGDVKYVDIDRTDGTVTLWNCTKDEVEEFMEWLNTSDIHVEEIDDDQTSPQT